MIKQLDDCKEIKSKELLMRYKESSPGNHTSYYLAYKDREEVAFLALDLVPNVGYLGLYDFLVPKDIREKGYGTYVLNELESFYSNSERRKIRLNPDPYDGDRSKEELIGWYKRRGYELIEDGTGEMEKIISRNLS